MTEDYQPDGLQLITPEKTAALIGVKVSTLAKWRCTGIPALPFVKVSRKVMYRPCDVRSYIEANLRSSGDVG